MMAPDDMGYGLSRRTLLQSGGGLVLGFVLPFGNARLQAQERQPASPLIEPNAFIRIGADDSVTVQIKHIEFGQGPFTSAATMVAEELDADWSQMRAEHAPANAALYNNLLMGPLQGTGGSSATAESYMQMRRAGAMVRWLLVQAASVEWRVPPADIRVADGVISHDASGRKSGFGAFADAAVKLKAPQDVPLKDPAQFKLIGRDRSVKRLDSSAKANGTAKFSFDQTGPGMLTVVVAHSPRFGGKVASFDASRALAVKGVVAVRQIPTGVAVYATSTWPAIKARKALDVVWDDGQAEKRGSEEMIAAYFEQAKEPGKVVRAVGDVEAGLSTAGAQQFQADYIFPYLAHAPMEPLAGYIEWDGKKAHARFGSQIPTFDHGAIARVLGIAQDQVQLELVFAGGSFGRRTTGDAHFAVELAETVKAIGPGKPVRLVWTREDDIHGGYYRPLMVHRMKGALKDGKIVAWSDSIIGQSFVFGGPLEAGLARNGIDQSMVEGSSKPPYGFPAFRCDVRVDRTPVTTLWWRSVGHSHSCYAVETFIDRMLEAAGKDPVAGRLEMMDEAPRAAEVLRAVAKLADWNGAPIPKGRARGVAVVEAFGSYMAQIAEVSIGDDGEPRVHKIWAAVDCGTVVNPDVVRAQIEGGVGFGIGHALYAELPLVDGLVGVSNFNDYRSLRIMEMPEVEVTMVASSANPSGIGEPAVPTGAPAIANALARLGRERPTRLPMVRPA